MSRGTVLTADSLVWIQTFFFYSAHEFHFPTGSYSTTLVVTAVAFFNKVIVRFVKRCAPFQKGLNRVVHKSSHELIIFVFNSTRKLHSLPNTITTIAILFERLNDLTRRRGHGHVFRRDLDVKTNRNLSMIMHYNFQ